ncbi:hypothetical protein B0H10DRAFT_2089879, partial [Mycena sp. CBHHK59/15]
MLFGLFSVFLSSPCAFSFPFFSLLFPFPPCLTLLHYTILYSISSTPPFRLRAARLFRPLPLPFFSLFGAVWGCGVRCAEVRVATAQCGWCWSCPLFEGAQWRCVWRADCGRGAASPYPLGASRRLRLRMHAGRPRGVAWWLGAEVCGARTWSGRGRSLVCCGVRCRSRVFGWRRGGWMYAHRRPYSAHVPPASLHVPLPSRFLFFSFPPSLASPLFLSILL